MSDFDDEPIEGSDSDGWDDEPVPASQRRSRASRSASADDPDGANDAGGAAPAQAKRRPPADDDWDDDWDDDDRGGRRDLTLVYAVVAAAIVIVLAVVLTQDNDSDPTAVAPTGGANTEQPGPPEKNWQGAVADAVGDKGADAQARVAKTTGVYIWTDFWGWHVRSNGSEPVVITVAADQVRVKETDDYDDADEDGAAPFTSTEQVTLPAGDGSEGAGFDLGNSESAIFTVTVDGQNVPANQIFLGGGDKGVADENPVTFNKA